ncbi:Protein Iojap/ribosomal silencing factor RsfS [Macleaya cordata]|uniref:Protein Iojap/ribosomal silencing factor RsfS n=1 Tax=Macleaya cordata TaxID=56857 RepID=A0A200QW28_MACCD|nr:Protein Iojap/ribosomal silencing factor RsfS [Macleaya cordata]
MSSSGNLGFLELQEVEKILNDVKADDVKVIPVNNQCDWTDYMVKQKQKGAERLLLPSVEGHQSGKWIVVDSGKVIIHALDEKARAYYNLESLWTTDLSTNSHNQI